MIKQLYRFLYTGFYSGYFPVAPGTAGTFVAAVLYVVAHLLIRDHLVFINMIALGLLLVPAVFLCDKGEKYFGQEDPGKVVLDEMLGYMTTVFFIPFTYHGALLAFICFRFFDILKPWPIRNVEKIGGGLGIVADDIIAGVYANITLRVILMLIALVA